MRVVHGANEQYFDNLEGKTVGSVRKSLRDVFNIPGDASALIGGKEVGDDFILEGGQNLEFTKEAGIKGGVAEEVSTKRIFLRNLDSGEPAFYCGSVENMEEVIKSIGYILEAELSEEVLQQNEDIEYRIEIKPMTDEEVEALPDI